jgi:outer membrane protease
MQKSKQQSAGRIVLSMALTALMMPATSWAQGQVVAKTEAGKPVSVEVTAGLGPMVGDVTYQIGGHIEAGGQGVDVHFPISELKWPVNVIMATLGGSLKIKEQIEMHGQLSKNLTTTADNMEDSDWTDFNNPGRKTIYSESDNEFNGWTADLGARYWLVSLPIRDLRGVTVALAVGGGVLHQQYDWEASNLNQVSVDPSFPSSRVSGTGITYKNTLTMPYLDVAGKVTFQRLTLAGALGFAPYAMVSDEDDHVLRSKLSKIDASGTAMKLSLQGRYDFTARLFALAQLEALSYDMDGTQDQSYYAGPQRGETSSVDAKVKSTQAMLTVCAGFKF